LIRSEASHRVEALGCFSSKPATKHRGTNLVEAGDLPDCLKVGSHHH
jgi:hypothetical protein